MGIMQSQPSWGKLLFSNDLLRGLAEMNGTTGMPSLTILRLVPRRMHFLAAVYPEPCKCPELGRAASGPTPD